MLSKAERKFVEEKGMEPLFRLHHATTTDNAGRVYKHRIRNKLSVLAQDLKALSQSGCFEEELMDLFGTFFPEKEDWDEEFDHQGSQHLDRYGLIW